MKSVFFNEILCIFEMHTSSCYMYYLKTQYELVNKYTAVSNLKSYILQVKNIRHNFIWGQN